MPRPISSPSEPVDTVPICTTWPSPSFMMEPLPKARSIWLSAASKALVLSMPPPSTTRNEFVMPTISQSRAPGQCRDHRAVAIEQ
jgi:hypothetical protein